MSLVISNAESLKEYSVVDPRGSTVGRFHTLAYGEDVGVLGFLPVWEQHRVVLLPWKGCLVDEDAQRIQVPDPRETLRLLKHVDVLAEVPGLDADEKLEEDLDRFFATLNEPAPAPQWKVDLAHRLGRQMLTSEWLVRLVHSSLAEAREGAYRSVRLAVPEHLYDTTAQILDRELRTSYCRGVVLQEPIGGNLPVELYSELLRGNVVLTGLKRFTEEEMRDFPNYVASLSGHGA